MNIVPIEVEYLKKTNTTLFLDVGANEGQTGRWIRKLGYAGRIVSFEPLASCHAGLLARAVDDTRWDVVPMGLGEAAKEATLNIANNVFSSSFRELSDLTRTTSDLAMTASETARIVALDDVFDNHYRPGDRVHLKIDTQGYEENVIEGARESLERIASVRMELAVRPSYVGQMPMAEMELKMRGLGYVVTAIAPGWRDQETDDVKEFDVLFKKL